MKIKAMEELKGIAILLVVFYHICGILKWKNVLHGEIGVDIFVVLSGIGLAMGYQSIDNKSRFLLKRFRKILPPYWIILTLFALIQTKLLHIGFDPKNFIYHVFAIHAYIHESYLFGYSDSFWYMSLILLLYLVYVPTSRFVGEEKPNHILTIGLTLTFLLTIYFSIFNPSGGTFFHLVLRVPGFFFGVIYGMYLRNPEMKFKFDLPSTIGLFILLFLILDKGYGYHYSLIGVAFVLAYFQLSRWMSQYAYINKIKFIFTFFGSISYEWYLLHQPFIREYNVYILTKVLGQNPSHREIEYGIFIMLILTILLAWCLKHLFDKKLLYNRYPVEGSF